MSEYCIIYGSSDNNPGPFVLAVSQDQQMISGFREEHYHLCRGGEICKDNRYETYSGDYEITEHMGHYMTERMVTDFCTYCTSTYNQIFGVTDDLERELNFIKFTEDEQCIIDDGFGLLSEHLYHVAPIEISELMEDSVYGSVLKIEECLERFLSTYQPNY